MAPTQTPPPPLPTLRSAELLQQAGSYTAVLKNPQFCFLWFGQIVSQLADRVVFVLFISLITAFYGANDAYNSWLYIAFTIPAIALTAIAGVFVDRWPRRGVLVSTNLARAGVIAMLPWAAKAGLIAIFAEAFLVSTATQFFVPAESATIPAIVDKPHLMQANALFTTTMMASVIFGFALGDPLIEWLGLEYTHWAIVGLFLVASGLLSQIRIQPRLHLHTPEASEETRPTSLQGVWLELKDGIAYLQSHPSLLRLMMKLAVLFSAVVALCILLITFARDYLYDDPQIAVRKFAYIISVSGIGMALGALLTSRWVKKISPSTTIGLGLIAFGCILAGLTTITWIPRSTLIIPSLLLTERIALTYTLAFFMGISVAMAAIPLQTTIHQSIEPNMRGKMMGIQFTLLSTCSTLPILLAGIGVSQIGVIPMFLGIALTLLGFGIWTITHPPKHRLDAH